MTWSHHQQRSRRAPKGQGLRHLKIQAGRPTLESSDDDSAAEESSEIATGGSGGSQPGQPAGDGAGAGEPPSENPVELPVVTTRDYFMRLGPSEVSTRAANLSASKRDGNTFLEEGLETRGRRGRDVSINSLGISRMGTDLCQPKSWPPSWQHLSRLYVLHSVLVPSKVRKQLKRIMCGLR